MTFRLELVGDNAVMGRMRAMPAAVHDSLAQVVHSLALRLEAKVERGKLQGQVLKHRTGKLSASIESVVMDQPDSIVGRVFSNGTAPYAAIHEFGFHGTESVKAHTRMQSQVFGRPVDPFEVFVSAFSRVMNMPERSFLRSTFRENLAQIEREMTDAVARAVQGETR